MASRITVRQGSQAVRNSRIHLQPSRIQHYSSQSLCRVPSTSGFRSFPPRRSTHFAQQSRNLSLWGWGSSSPKANSTAETAPTSNVNILEPSQFESIRTVKATDTNSDLSHNPNAFEPQFVEDVQQAIAQPHGGEAAHVPLEQIPERIGYLYEVCGIDFGWGPSSVMQWVIEHIHIWGDLSWTTTIIVMSVGLRTLLVPFVVEAARQGAKMKLMTTTLKPIQEKLAQAKQRDDQLKVQEYTNEMRVTTKAYGVKFSRLLAPMLIQFPLGFAAWRNLRNCATLPVPGFVTESWLWNVDLTFSDQYYAVPAASALLIWASLRVNSRVTTATGTGMANQDAMKLVKGILPPLSFAFMIWQPGAVQLYFLCSSAMGYLTTYTMSLDSVRNFLGLATASNPTAAPGAPTAPVAPFMKRRQTVIDVQAKTVPDSEVKTSSQATTQNISFIDRKIGEVKSTFKGAASFLDQSKATEAQTKKKEIMESARLRAAMEQARRERNARFGAQEEKERKKR